MLNGFRIAFHSNDCNRIIRGLRRQIQKNQLASSLHKPHRSTCREKPSRLHLESYASDCHRSSWPEIDGRVKRISLTCVRANVAVRKTAPLRGIHSISIVSQPYPDRPQPADARFRNGTIRSRANVQQVISAVTSTLDEVLHKLLSRLPVVITGEIRPAVVHGHARFPISSAGLGSLFRCREIAPG